MRRAVRRFAVMAGVLAMSLPVFSETNQEATLPISTETRAAVRQLIGDSMLNSEAYEYDRHLADLIGPRLTGSANYMRAAEWAQQEFRSLGLQNVHTEEWTIPATWEPDGPAVGRLVSPVEHTLHIYSVGWSPSTPPGGVKGEVVYVKSIVPADLDAQKDKLHGAVALLDEASFGEKPKLDATFTGVEHLRSLGPAAILIPGGEDGTENLTSLNFSGAAGGPRGCTADETAARTRAGEGGVFV